MKVSKLSLIAHLTIVTHLDQNVTKRQRYKNLTLYLSKKGGGMFLNFDVSKKKNIVPLKGVKCHTRHLESHGLFTISLHCPRTDYMIKTNSQSDNVALMSFFRGTTSKYERNDDLVKIEIGSSLTDKQQKINDLVIKLNVLPEILLSNQMDLSKKSLTELPRGFGDLEPLVLSLGSNNFGSNLNYWSWVFGNIRYTLHTLSLADNKLVRFPMEILALARLKSLNLADNDLRALPSSLFCHNRSLHTLILENNRNLSCIPSITKPFYSLNIINCIKLFQPPESDEIRFDQCGVPKLKYFAAKIVLHARLPYRPSTVPRNLVTYLDDHIECSGCRNCVPAAALYKLQYCPSPARETYTNAGYLSFKASFCFACRNKCRI